MHEAGVVRLIDLKAFLYLCRYSFIDHFVDEGARLLRINHLIAISVNHFALIVHHVIHIERAFANEIIALLDAFLCRFDRFVEPWMLKLLSFLKTEALHDSGHPISRAEVAHEIVFEADIKSRTSGIALARATPAQLPLYPARFVA